MDISARLAQLDISLPQPWTLPPGLDVAFDIVVVSRGQAWLAGHGPVDGSDMLMSGVVGGDLAVEQGAEAARLAGLSMLASLERALGDLSRVSRWVHALPFNLPVVVEATVDVD